MKLYIQIDANNKLTACGTTPIGENSIELEVDSAIEVIMNSSSYVYEDGELIKSETAELENLKIQKDQELNDSCKKAILYGFKHTINDVLYLFSFDTEAQLNFQGAERLLDNGSIAEVPWTVTNCDTNKKERIMITKVLMDVITNLILQHKMSSVAKYRDVLYPQLMSAVTAEEIDLIKW